MTVITLTTDFGLRDGFAGILKSGVSEDAPYTFTNLVSVCSCAAFTTF